jgi:hypothetical protein
MATPIGKHLFSDTPLKNSDLSEMAAGDTTARSTPNRTNVVISVPRACTVIGIDIGTTFYVRYRTDCNFFFG